MVNLERKNANELSFLRNFKKEENLTQPKYHNYKKGVIQ